MAKELTTVSLKDNILSLKGSIKPQAMMNVVAGLVKTFNVDVDKIEMKDFEVSFTLDDDGTVEFVPEIKKEDVPGFCGLIFMLTSFGNDSGKDDDNE